ncbi:MAG TPA: GDSL-type esterase/lipase family protein [Pirellulales bacterium]|nr:GDSL-type esterase/lipase family protein [Pirellulales bacterium]
MTDTTPSPKSARPKSARRGRWRWLKLCLPFVALVAGELTLRVYTWCRGWTPNCYAAQLRLFRPNEEIGTDLRPGFHMRSGVYSITINSLGLRGPEISREKARGVVRVAIVGESSAFGYLVDDADVAARRLEANLRARGLEVEVLNAGVPGYNLFHSTVRYREVVAPLAPDVVLVYLGWNDLAYVVRGPSELDRFRVRPVAPGWERLLGQSTLYGLVAYRLLGASARMMPSQIGGTRPTESGAAAFHANLARLADLVGASGARLVVCAQATAAHPHVSPRLAAVLAHSEEDRSDVIWMGMWLRDREREFAAERHVPFLDAYDAIPPTEEFLADYIHLTVAGERELAEFWTRKLLPLLAKVRYPPQVRGRSGR